MMGGNIGVDMLSDVGIVDVRHTDRRVSGGSSIQEVEAADNGHSFD